GVLVRYRVCGRGGGRARELRRAEGPGGRVSGRLAALVRAGVLSADARPDRGGGTPGGVAERAPEQAGRARGRGAMSGAGVEVPRATAAMPAERNDAPVAVSVIVPVSERSESLTDLYREFSAPLRATGRPFEFLFICEPWAHALAGPVLDLARAGEPVRVLEVAASAGETTLLKAAAAHARAGIVLTLPAYRRVEAETLPGLVARVEQGADIALACRWPRRDSWVNRLQNRVLHALIGGVAGAKLHDIACGVRAMRRDVLMDLPVYGDLARFLPLFALREGYRVVEV